MPNTAVRNYFFAASVMDRYRSKFTKSELIILAALDIDKPPQQGQRLYSLHRFCEKHHHCWDYRNFKKIMDRLVNTPWVQKIGICYSLTIDGMLLVAQLDRQLQKLTNSLER